MVPPMAGAAGGDLAGQVSLGGGYGYVASGISKVFLSFNTSPL